MFDPEETGGGVPAAVRRFIDRRLRNVQQLEIVLLLHQHAARSWDAGAVADALRLTERDAAGNLEELARGNLLDVRLADRVLYRFNPGTPQLAAAVKLLAEAYRERRGDVLRAIMIRRASLRDFSDAFRLKED